MGLKAFQTRLGTTSFLPSDLGTRTTEADQRRLLIQASIVLSILGMIWGTIYFVFDEPRSGFISMSYSVLSWIAFLVYRRTKRYDLFRFSQLLLILLLPFFLLIDLGGYRSSGAVVLWSLTSPMGALIFTKPQYAARWFLAFFALVLAGMVFEIVGSRPSHMPSEVVSAFFLLNVNGVCTLVFLLLHNFLLQRERLRAIERAYLDQELMLRQNEKLATLGKLSAGMAHELNNPASAVMRGASQLEKAFAEVQTQNNYFYTINFTEAQIKTLAELCKRCENHPPLNLDGLERSDRESSIESWLLVPDGWQYAQALVELGFTVDDLQALFAPFNMQQRLRVLAWLNATFSLHDILKEVGQGATQITHLVKALKSYSYLDQAPIQMVDVHEGLDDTLLMLRSKLKDGINIHRQYDTDLPRIQAYGSELNQVWTNIIDNASDAMNGKGDIQIRTRHDDKWVIIEIEDNGVGIPEDIVSKVFDPFFTTKAPGSGTGLGLNISHNIIVQKHQGQMGVHSEPGRTCFRVKLPIR